MACRTQMCIRDRYKLDSILDGALDEVIDALATADRAEKLKAAGEEGA